MGSKVRDSRASRKIPKSKAVLFGVCTGQLSSNLVRLIEVLHLGVLMSLQLKEVFEVHPLIFLSIQAWCQQAVSR
jgi:hypothetical protein